MGASLVEGLQPGPEQPRAGLDSATAGVDGC
jgi:hypothetical protein